MKSQEPESTEREGKIAARAEKNGYALYPPTGDRWLLVDEGAGGWATHDSLDEVEGFLADYEDLGEEDAGDVLGDDSAESPPVPRHRPVGPVSQPPWATEVTD